MSDVARRSSFFVATGIFVSRLLGFVRVRVFAHFFGNGMEADAFNAALRIPNAIRNLLGEGTLSASFIPVYAQLLEIDDERRARSLAGTIISLLVIATIGTALIGVSLAPVLTKLVVPAFDGETYELTVRLVRILFPMAGVMIVSAWCLGILNAHRKFFLSYAAPAVWNIVQIGTLVVAGAVLSGIDLVVALAWGALAGSVGVVLVQLPSVWQLTGHLAWSTKLSDDTRKVLRAWGPVVIGAGVMQISSVIDTILGSFVGPGAVANLGYAQQIAILPVSLFGISIAAVALPDLSRSAISTGNTEIQQTLSDGLERIWFFVFPSTVAFVALGQHLVGPLYETGAFTRQDTLVVTSILVAYGIGLPARSVIKLLTSGHYAFGDTKTPLGIATAGVVLSAIVSILLMPTFGAVGIALGASVGAYAMAGLNYLLLRRRVGAWMKAESVRRGVVAAVAAVTGATIAAQLPVETVSASVAAQAVIVLSTFSVCYLGLARLFGHPEARRMLRR